MPDTATKKVPGLFKNPVTRSFALLIFLFLLAASLFSIYKFNIHADPAEIFIFNQLNFRSDAPASFLVFLRNGKTMDPIKHEQVNIELRDGKKTLRDFQVETGPDGVALVKLDKVPTVSQPCVVAEYRGLDTSISLADHNRARCSISSDKPLYQPGQTVHVRTLTLDSVTLKPFADKNLNIKILDPADNVVFDTDGSSSEFGIASADFKLGDQVNTGCYKIRIANGEGVSGEKSFYVEHYEKPRFTISPSINNHFLFPGNTLSGSVCSKYIFGEPVKNAKVSVRLFSEYMERVLKQSDFVPIFGSSSPSYVDEKRETLVTEINGETGCDGAYRFEMMVPEKFRDANIQDGVKCRLEISVSDASGQVAGFQKKLLATLNPVSVSFIPEAQHVLPGIENRFFINAVYPDGEPAKVNLRIRNEDYETDKEGLCEFVLKKDDSPGCLRVKVNDLIDHVYSTETIDIPFEKGPDLFIVKTDKLIYSEGEELAVEILANFDQGRVYLDMEKDGVSFLMSAVDVKGRKGSLGIALPQGLSGTVRLYVYKILPQGKIERTMRLIQITKKETLNIAASFDKKVYRPGETAKAGFVVTGNDGRPTCAALSIAAVDKSVEALKYRQGPLFSKMSVLVREELFNPKFRQAAVEVIEGEWGTSNSLFDKYVFSHVEKAFQFSCVHSGTYFEREKKVIEDKIAYGDSFFSKLILLLLIIYFAILSNMFFETVSKKTRNQLIVAGEKKIPASARMNRISMAFVCGTIFPGILGLFVTSGLLNDDFIIGPLIISAVIVIFSLIFLLRGRNSLYRFFESSNRVHDIADTAVLLFFLFVIVFIAFNCAVYFFPNTPHLFLMCFTQLMLSFVPAVCLFTLKANIVGEGELAGKLQNAALGAGLGRRKKKVWLWFIVALCYAGPLIGIYFGVMIIVLALFMPLVCVIEKIGGDGGGGSSWSCSFNNKRPEYFSIKEPGSYFENLESGETRNGMAPVRRFFPETLLWKPELVTDPEGRASLEFKVGDSITDYALRAGAVSRDGRLGDAGCELRVFQNFFIDLYPPPKVTVDDEISIPVVLYNYLDKAQNIKLGIKEDPSFNVLAKPAEKKVDAKSTAKVYVPVRFIKTGSCVIRLTVESDSGCRDTVEREIKVVPDGRMVEEAINGFLVKNNSGTYEFPSRAFPENRSCFFKLYPAPMAEIPDTVANMMRMPSGCFEQSSSITYPNILIYKYLKDHGKLSSANAETAKGYISTGYQKILSYQNGDGGFSLYNRWESSPLLTAYGIFILSEIEKEFHLGGRSLEGALAYIREVFRKENHGGLNLRETAYIVMALYDSGRSLYVPEEARNFIVRNADGNNDPYTLALCANALLIYDRVQARRILERLDGMKTESEGYCWWASSSGDRGVFNTSDKWLDIETTALIVNAMNRADFAPETIYKSVCWLMSMRSSNGLWGSTQSTVQVMRALLGIKSSALFPLGKGEKVDVKLSFNSLAKSLNIKNDDGILPYSVDLETELKPGSNRFSVTSSRSAPLAYRFVMTYYMPWDVRPAGRGLELSVVYGKAELKPGEELDCFVEIKNSTRIDVPMGMISMNIPPGFEGEEPSMKKLYNEKVVSNYSMDSEKIVFYFNEFSSRNPLKFSFRLKAKYPVKVKTPPVCAYAYYQPELSVVSAPQRLTVAEDKIRSEK